MFNDVTIFLRLVSSYGWITCPPFQRGHGHMIYVLWSYKCSFLYATKHWLGCKKMRGEENTKGIVGETVLDIKRAIHLLRLGKICIAARLMNFYGPIQSG